MAVERSLKKGREMRTQLGGQRGLGLGRPQRMPGPRASRASWPGAASSEPVPLTLQNKRFQQAPPKKRKKLLFFAQAFVAEAPRRPFGWASEPGRCHGDRDSRRGPLPGVDLPQLGPEPGGTKKKKKSSKYLESYSDRAEFFSAVRAASTLFFLGLPGWAMASLEMGSSGLGKASPQNVYSLNLSPSSSFKPPLKLHGKGFFGCLLGFIRVYSPSSFTVKNMPFWSRGACCTSPPPP